jgi:hypothetical protein
MCVFILTMAVTVWLAIADPIMSVDPSSSMLGCVMVVLGNVVVALRSYKNGITASLKTFSCFKINQTVLDCIIMTVMIAPSIGTIARLVGSVLLQCSPFCFNQPS